jgi:deoxyadenosine/deoxycytidine kinase
MLIVVEGCIGAGKTTVANGLGAYRTSKVLLERFQENPFLRAFYKDPVGNATETEFAFLLLHFHQLKESSEDIAKHEVVTDFHLGKDLLYARTNLGTSRTLGIFTELHDDLAGRLPPLALMICLSATTDLLLERIRQRNREFELKIDPVYYARINAAYEEFFENYTGRKLRVSMDESDFVQNPELYKRLSALVDSELSRL